MSPPSSAFSLHHLTLRFVVITPLPRTLPLLSVSLEFVYLSAFSSRRNSVDRALRHVVVSPIAPRLTKVSLCLVRRVPAGNGQRRGSPPLWLVTGKTRTAIPTTD